MRAATRFACGALAILSVATVAAQNDRSGQWTTYSGSLSSHRFSPLTQLTPDTVTKLRPRNKN